MEKIYTCNICGTNSEVQPFYKGLTSRCKDCHKAKVEKNREERADYYREYDANRFQNDPRVKARHRRYQKTESGKASMLKSRAKWLDENADKRAARVILGNAVRDGRIDKPDTCSKCGERASRIHGHHDDYTKPLDVVWCCPTCHHEIHNPKV